MILLFIKPLCSMGYIEAAQLNVDQPYMGCLDHIQQRQKGKAWDTILWSRPEAILSGKTLDAEVLISTKNLSPENLFKLALKIEAHIATPKVEQDLRKYATIIVLDWLLQSYLLGYDPAFARIYRYAKDTRLNNSFAQNLLGLIYAIGAKVDEKSDLSREYFVAAHRSNLDQARINLLLCGDINEEQKLISALIQQARKGDREASYRLSCVWDEKDEETKKELFSIAVRLYHPEALSQQAEVEIKESVENRNLAIVADHCKEASSQGHATATARLATLYREGRGVERDADRANGFHHLYVAQIKLFNVRKGNIFNRSFRETNEYPQYTPQTIGIELTPWVSSCLRGYLGDLGHLEKAWNGLKNVLWDLQEFDDDVLGIQAFEELKKYAQGGYKVAQYQLACCYLDGVGIPKNDYEAFKWFKKIADQGHMKAQYELAICYRDGKGIAQAEVEQAKIIAFQWFKKAADQGHKDAQYELAICYRDGLGVDYNEAEALKWFKLAADQGHEEARNSYMACDCGGRIVERVVPLIAKGHEEIFKRFLRGRLVYKKGALEEKMLYIADLEKPLEGIFDLSGFGEISQYLSVAMGYKQAKNLINVNKLEVWITPRFLIEEKLRIGHAMQFQPIMNEDKWPLANDVGIFWTEGDFDVTDDNYDYLTSQTAGELGHNHLSQKHKGAVIKTRLGYDIVKNQRNLSMLFD